MNEYNFPDEVFDNSSEEENYPELGATSLTEEETDLEPDTTDSTDDGDADLLLHDEPQSDTTRAVDPDTIDTTNDGDGDLFKDDEA